MWGGILLEANVMTNFDIGFSNTKTDTLIHLTQWQYWWWFWFSFLFSLYYLMLSKVFRTRVLKFKPKIATSYRPHGKWGDLIVCLIPVSWCANIISNSNLILRMIEWQAESSLFTIRIRGKQWYWVYKFDLKAVTDIMSAPKNIGHDKWFISTPGAVEVADNYLHALQLRSQNKWVQKYWNKEVANVVKRETIDHSDTIELYAHQTCNKEAGSSNEGGCVLKNPDDFDYTKLLRSNPKTTNAARLLKQPASNKNEFDFESSNTEMFRFRFNDESINEQKVLPHNTTFSIKQKRYKRRKIIYPRVKFWKDVQGKQTKNIKYTNFVALVDNNLVEPTFNQTVEYNVLKKKKIKAEITSVALSKRMLRTKRTLVLPANVNLTAITNSYDVIHSWFIPGLGLKMDCIPGRATHHTFYIDNAGFYYGQCAEVCGRFHHHMPIRICALPFEHFILWWHNFGIPKFLSTQNKKNISNYYSFRKYVW